MSLPAPEKPGTLHIGKEWKIEGGREGR